MPVLVLIVLSLLIAVFAGWSMIRTSALEDEVAALRKELFDSQLALMEQQAQVQRYLVRDNRVRADLVDRVAEFREDPAATPEEPDVPAPVVSAPPPLASEAKERLRRGRKEFKRERYEKAELQFFRALPDGYLYLALSSLARGDVHEAAAFLGQAMRADPEWLKRLRPRELFGSAEAFDRVLAAIQAVLRADPLDGEAKLLLAYLHYHEKGAPYAKALLTELLNAEPEHAGARAFMETLEN